MIEVDEKEKIVFNILERGINKETLKEVDKHINMIPITFDKIIKSLFLISDKSVFKNWFIKKW